MRLTLADLDHMPVALITALKVLAADRKLGEKPYGVD